jgi:hypothetical protein
MHGEHPSLGSGDEVGVLQLLGVSVFSDLQDFGNGSLTTFYSGCSGMRLGKLHVELPSVDLGFFGSVDAIPQLRALLVMLLIEGKQVGAMYFMVGRLLDLVGLPCERSKLDGSSPGVGRISWACKQWALHRSSIGVTGLYRQWLGRCR